MFSSEKIVHRYREAEDSGHRIKSLCECCPCLFGLLYGRGAAAIAREVEKAGVSCTIDEARQFVEQFMEQFPKVAKLIADTHDKVVTQGYVETLWGRREYFYKVAGDDGTIEARQKRMAFNFIIQSYVADLLREALIHLREHRRKSGLDYKLILTVHDSIMLESAVECAEEVAERVLPVCMSELARAPKLGFSVSCDVDIYRRWDVAMYYDEMLEMGFSDGFARKMCKKSPDGEPMNRSAA